jgi:hypothetical protein
MVKDVKMCKSAGETAHAHHGKKQKGGKNPTIQHIKVMLPAKSGAANPQNIIYLATSIRATVYQPKCRNPKPPNAAVPIYKLT